MWVAKLTVRHDCIIGNRCREFGIVMQSLDLSEEKKGSDVLTSSIHQLIGDEKAIKAFVASLRKDPRTKHAELNGKTLFLMESSKKKPVSEYSKRMFWVKPVIIDTEGYEHYEIGSHEKAELTGFIERVKKNMEYFELQSIKKVALNNIYFPKVMPQLTALQQQALELAISQGYYAVPKKTNLRALAKLSGVSLATYQKHLQKAESKIIPDILSFLK